MGTLVHSRAKWDVRGQFLPANWWLIVDDDGQLVTRCFINTITVLNHQEMIIALLYHLKDDSPLSTMFRQPSNIEG